MAVEDGSERENVTILHRSATEAIAPGSDWTWRGPHPTVVPYNVCIGDVHTVRPMVYNLILIMFDVKVDGAWSEWTAAICSATCGTGTQQKFRKCDNPSHLLGGANCIGATTVFADCSIVPCQGILYA